MSIMIIFSVFALYILASIVVVWFMLDMIIDCLRRIGDMERKLKDKGLF
jgi:hypothetical protein